MPASSGTIQSEQGALAQTLSARLWWLPLVVITGLGFLHWLLPYGAGSTAVIAGASLLAGLLVLAAWALRRDLYQRTAWLLIGLAAIVSSLGQAFWYGHDLTGAEGDPLVANLFYLATYALAVVALWLYGRRVESHLGALVDSLMITVAAAVVFWVLMIEPAWQDVEGRLAAVLFAMAYPTAGLLLLTVTLKAFFVASQRSVSLVLLVTAIGTLLVADLIHAHGVTTGWYRPGGATHMLWFLVYGLAASAVWHGSAVRPFEHPREAAQRPFLRLLFIGLICISVPTMILVTGNADTRLVQVGATASIVLFLLMLFRMTLLLQSNQRKADRLERLVREDPLTGAANRRGLEERLDLEVARARRTGTPLMVAFLDLDYFKHYNDHHGHAAGDALLREAVARWWSELRNTDLLARVGGEEFVVVLADTPREDAQGVVERLRAVVPEGQTCSAGLASMQTGDEADALLARADAALYDAKAQGRNQLVVRNAGQGAPGGIARQNLAPG